MHTHIHAYIHTSCFVPNQNANESGISPLASCTGAVFHRWCGAARTNNSENEKLHQGGFFTADVSRTMYSLRWHGGLRIHCP